MCVCVYVCVRVFVCVFVCGGVEVVLVGCVFACVLNMRLALVL